MDKKTCFKCKEVKRLSDFYKHSQMEDGYLNKCKECVRKYAGKQYASLSENPEWMAKERKRCREKNKRLDFWGKYKKKLTKTKRAKLREIKERWRQNNPIARKAHMIAGNAKRSGRLKPQPCAVCGNEKVEMHHADYSKPLEVTWLCRKHHGEVHWKDS